MHVIDAHISQPGKESTCPSSCRDIQGKDKIVESFTGGLWARGNMQGITNDTIKFPSFVKCVNKFLRAHGQIVWTSFVLQKNVATEVHMMDVHNLKGWPTTTVTFASFDGGELWVALGNGEDALGKNIAYRNDPQGRSIPGYLVNTYENPYLLDPHRCHATQPWEGERWLLSCYATRGTTSTPVHLQESLDFRFPSSRAPLSEGNNEDCFAN